MSVKEAVDAVDAFELDHITITGGEPLLEENKEWMTEFIRVLLLSGYEVDVETNGSIDYSYWKEKFKGDSVYLIMDWKAPSSKMNSFMLESNLLILDEKDIIKIVVQDEDFDEVEKILNSNTVVERDHNKINYNKDYCFINAECCQHLLRDLRKVEINILERT